MMQLPNVIRELLSFFTGEGDKVALGVSWKGMFSKKPLLNVIIYKQ